MGYSYHPYCEYWTEPEIQTDNDMAEIETATHILCNCPAFSAIRSDIQYTLAINQLFSRSTKTNITKIITFIKRSKCFERLPKLNKRDLSPKRVNKKRKTDNKNSQLKRTKINKMNQYYI